MIRAGELRHRIDLLEDQGTTRDTHGEPVPDWVVVEARVPAKKLASGGAEGLASNQVHANQSVEFEVRYRDATRRPNMRLRFNDQLYDIEYFDDPDGLQERQVIRAVRRDA